MSTSNTSSPSEPLFTLMLLENGGGFSPKTLDQISAFVQTEIAFWAWLQNNQSHVQGFRNAISQLSNVNNYINQAKQYLTSHPTQYQNSLNDIQSTLHNIFINLKLPHSTSTLGKRIEAYKTDQNPEAASYFASVFYPPPQGHHFQPLQYLLGVELLKV